MDASTWVPLVTAGAGLIAGLAAGLVSTVLARRWASEDRRAAWQREDRLRWHADRLQVYARMIAALQAWDAALQRILERRKDAESAGGSPPSFDAAEWDRHSEAVLELIAQLRLMAPEQVTNRALRCYRMFGVVRLQLRGAEDAGLSRLLAAESEAAETTRSVIGAMRADLGLGGDMESADKTAPHPAGEAAT
jgi:hypothetical protein